MVGINTWGNLNQLSRILTYFNNLTFCKISKLAKVINIINNLLKKQGLKNIQPISDGDKIKFAYLKLPNPVKDTVISVPDFLPTELGLDEYIDRDMQFLKTFIGPVSTIATIIGWSLDDNASLEDFFS